jgi:probable HAF family extracellular repeat protein
LPGTAIALNDAGQVAGTNLNPDSHFTETFIYDDGVVSTLALGREAVPAAINAVGQIAGFQTEGGDSPTIYALIWNGSAPPAVLSGGGFYSGTEALAINDSGEIVGTFTPNDDIYMAPPNHHAFFAANGVVTVFDPPGAVLSNAVDVNNAGQIVGYYTDASGQSHAFLDQNGTFTSFAPPDAVWSQATHINASGVIIGEYALSGESPPDQEYAFVYNNGSITKLEAAGTSLSVATAINASGEVVGYYDTGSQSHAFVDDNGYSFTIDPPGATSSEAVGINALGEVVGNYTDANGSHVFVYDHGAFTTIDEPGATSISAVAINDNGQVIGNYEGASGGQGIIADPVYGKTWVGSADNNDAGNPANWSPAGAPQPGDTLLLPSGSTIDIRGNDLQGDPLVLATGYSPTGSLAASATLNLSHQADVTLENGAATLGPASAIINVAGCDTLDLISTTQTSPAYGDPLSVTVNLASEATLNGTFDLGYGSSLTVTGDGHARFINAGTDTLAGADASIETGVYGSGSFNLTVAGVSPTAASGGHLTFTSFVSKDQVIDVTGDVVAQVARPSEVDIAAPQDFHGILDLHDFSLVNLAGLARADAWSFKNDMLTIFGGCGQVADRVHVISDADATLTGGVHGLSVSMNSNGQILVSPGADFHGTLGAAG